MRRAPCILVLLASAPGCALVRASDDPDGAGGGDAGIAPGGGEEVALVVPEGRVDEDLVDYPLLVALEDVGELTSARADGSDLAFVQDGETLAHEIESFDAESGTLVAWVLVPLLSSEADNLFTLRVTGEAAASRASEVWDGFRGVWHLREPGDATGRGVVATASGDVEDDGALIAGGVGLRGGYLEMADPADHHLDFALGDSFTASMWLRRDVTTEELQIFLSKGGTEEGEVGYSIEVSDEADEIYGCLADDDTYWCTDDAILPDGWVLVHFVVDRAEDEMRIYLDGGSGATDNGIGDVDPDFEGNGYPLRVGATWEATYAARGAADEVRIREGVLSPAWIAADAASQSGLPFVERAGE